MSGRTGSRTTPAPVGLRVWPTLVLLFLAIVTDGVDASSFGFVVPTLSRVWGLAPATFTLALVATNVGVVLGYVSSAWFVARFGTRRTIVASVLVYSVFVSLTPLAGGIAAMAALRLLTGIGLGVVLPAAVSLATHVVAAHRRNAAAVGVTLGLAFGATLSGFIGGAIITGLGWEFMFWIPSGVAVLLGVLLWWRLPRTDVGSVPVTTGAAPVRSSVRGLFAPDLRARTIVLWAFALLIFVATYVLQSWMPTFLIEYGFRPDQAPMATAAGGIGGLVGGIVLAVLAARFGAPRMLALLTGLSTVFLVLLAVTAPGAAGVLILIALTTAGTTGGCVGQSGLAVTIYDGALRTAGVGWAAALGRIGSILGPAVGGVLLAIHVPATTILLITAVPVLLACVLMSVFGGFAARVRRPGAPIGGAAEAAL